MIECLCDVCVDLYVFFCLYVSVCMYVCICIFVVLYNCVLCDWVIGSVLFG